MNSCSSCGSPVPDGQRYCSMCYGDPEYGRDGYYKAFLEEQERQAEEKIEAERQELESYYQNQREIPEEEQQ